MTNSRDLIAMAGWTPDRRIDVGGELAELEEAGFAVVPSVVGFLEKYTGLTISSKDGTRTLLIDGRQAARHAGPEWCAAYAEAIGLSVTPVGEYSHMVLVIDATGRFWGGFDAAYGFLGDDIAEVVHGLLVEPGSRRLDHEVAE
jgi:hypothetical protein